MAYPTRLVFLVVAALTVACSTTDDGPVPDAAALSERLLTAAPGDIVELLPGRFVGAFEVPGGVTVRGAGSTESYLQAPADEVGVRLGVDAQLADVTVEGGGADAVYAEGEAGAISLDSVVVRANAGRAVVLRGLAGATITNLSIVGPVTPENAQAVPPNPDATQTLTHGLVLVGVGREGEPVQIDRLHVVGAGRFAGLWVDSHVACDDCLFESNLGTTLMAHGGAVAATGGAIRGTLQGIQAPPAYAAVFAGGVGVVTAELAVEDNEGYGVVQDGGTATHERPTISRNREPAVWAQRDAALELMGVGGVLADNRLAGVVLAESQQVSIRDITIRGTQEAPRIESELGEIRVGDGLHVMVESTLGLSFSDLTIEGNERVGLLLDVGSGNVGTETLRKIVVDAPAQGFGAIAQGPSGPIEIGAWAADIERRGEAAANDPTVRDRLDVVGIIAPMFLPRAD